jgi:hypothetical protein
MVYSDQYKCGIGSLIATCAWIGGIAYFAVWRAPPQVTIKPAYWDCTTGTKPMCLNQKLTEDGRLIYVKAPVDSPSACALGKTVCFTDDGILASKRAEYFVEQEEDDEIIPSAWGCIGCAFLALYSLVISWVSFGNARECWNWNLFAPRMIVNGQAISAPSYGAV